MSTPLSYIHGKVTQSRYHPPLRHRHLLSSEPARRNGSRWLTERVTREPCLRKLNLEELGPALLSPGVVVVVNPTATRPSCALLR